MVLFVVLNEQAFPSIIRELPAENAENVLLALDDAHGFFGRLPYDRQDILDFIRIAG